MFKRHRAWCAGLILSISAVSASAQERDSVLNGALIGAGAGIGATMALDAVFCDNGFGGCETPWAAYFTLGGIGAGAGAGIDWLIGRKPDPTRTTLRLAPILSRTRRGVAASLVLPSRASLPHPSRARQDSPRKRDSAANGAWIGAGIGAASGFIWSRSACGWNDDECAVYTGLVGIPVGIGIGAAAGAIADALHQ